MMDRGVISDTVKRALDEDIGKGDITTKFTVSSELKALGVIVAKEKGVLAGGKVALEVFKQVDEDVEVTLKKNDGEKFSEGDVIAQVMGRAVSLLSAERVALNFLQRLCGIATFTSKYVETVKGTKVKVMDTRKTTPNLRMLEKYAVRMGGGYNHRMGLYDQILIKDNHISMGRGVGNVLNKIKDVDSGRVFIEIEVKNLRQLKQVLEFDVDRIMLDNMDIEDIKRAVKMVDGKCELEVSGNVNLKNIRTKAETGVDCISVGALTHSYRSIDLNMKIREIG